jgi:hypothetical protein
MVSILCIFLRIILESHKGYDSYIFLYSRTSITPGSQGKAKQFELSKIRITEIKKTSMYLGISGVHFNLSSKRALKNRLWTHHGLQITEQLFKSNLTFCGVCVFTLQTDECVFTIDSSNANFDEKFKWTFLDMVLIGCDSLTTFN